MKWKSWKEIEIFFKENQNVNLNELGKKINKSKSYVSKLRKFVFAAEEEKYQLAKKERFYAPFLEMYLKNKEGIKAEEETEETEEIEEIDEIEKLKNYLLEQIKEVKRENEELKERLKIFTKDSYLCRRNLNKCVNEREQLKLELAYIKKIINNSPYFLAGLTFILLGITFLIKG